MINLFYAALLCIVQFLPFPCLASKACDASYVDNVTYLEGSGEVVSRKSIDFWEQGPIQGELVIADGYSTNYQELASSETWLKMEETFGNVWSDFNTDYGSWRFFQVIPCSGLYVQVPTYTYNGNSYEDAYNYVSSNYSSYLVTEMVIYNRFDSMWADNGYYYSAHAIDFRFTLNGVGKTLEVFFYKSNSGANQCSYSLDYRLFTENVSGYESINSRDYCFFATDNFTYTDVFYVSDYWLMSEGAETSYRDGYQTGYNVGVETGKTAGETTGYGNGYQDGYQEGLAHADYDSTALTIMQGIIDVGLLPVNVFLMMLNFEVFGVNISGFVSALLTISIVIIIVRFLFGGKSDD